MRYRSILHGRGAYVTRHFVLILFRAEHNGSVRQGALIEPLAGDLALQQLELTHVVASREKSKKGRADQVKPAGGVRAGDVDIDLLPHERDALEQGAELADLHFGLNPAKWLQFPVRPDVHAVVGRRGCDRHRLRGGGSRRRFGVGCRSFFRHVGRREGWLGRRRRGGGGSRVHHDGNQVVAYAGFFERNQAVDRSIELRFRLSDLGDNEVLGDLGLNQLDEHPGWSSAPGPLPAWRADFS